MTPDDERAVRQMIDERLTHLIGMILFGLAVGYIINLFRS